MRGILIKKQIGGREYTVVDFSKIHTGGKPVQKVYTLKNGKTVIAQEGQVTHPDGTVTPE